MKQQDRNRLLYGMAVVMLAAGGAYACKDFLNIPPQGTVVEASLETKAGVEGTLIAAYRSLDCSSSSAGSWGCAASNWVWGSVPSGDAHKGSNAGDQQPINDIETFSWAVGEAEGYLNQKWRTSRCRDRKSTRLNSSHTVISYAVFCLKKKINII